MFDSTPKDPFVTTNNLMAMFARNALQNAEFRVFTSQANKYRLQRTFINNLPEDQRDSHQCNECYKFLADIGSLVTIDPRTLEVKSVLWNWPDVPEMYKASFAAMAALVQNAPIWRQWFNTSTETFGSFGDDKHRHFYIHDLKTLKPPGNKSCSKTNDARGSDQSVALFTTLKRTMENITAGQLERLVTEAFAMTSMTEFNDFNSDLEWLWDLAEQYEAAAEDKRMHLLWVAVANTNPKRITIWNALSVKCLLTRGSREGMTSKQVLESFLSDEGRNPSIVKTGVLGDHKERERLSMVDMHTVVSALGAEKSFERRSARLDEIPGVLWKVTKEDGVEESLSPRGDLFDTPEKDAAIIRRGFMSMKEFMETVAPVASNIYLHLSLHTPYNFGSANTAVHPDAGRILINDKPDARNPVTTWNASHGGTMLSQWGGHSHGCYEVSQIFRDWTNAASKEIYWFALNGLKVPQVTIPLFREDLVEPLRIHVRNINRHLVTPIDVEGGFVGISLATKGQTELTVLAIIDGVTHILKVGKELPF